MTQAIKRFKVDAKELSQQEKVLLDKLILAAELLAPLYLKQKNSKYPGANFYPSDVTKEEVEKAAEKDPAILSPYTFVERNKSGKLIAVPYHKKFEKELKKISEVLKEAALLSKDKELKDYLRQRAEDMLTDNYDKSNILWLKTENSKIGCVIGPFDRYLDKLFFKKRAYMAWMGILDEKETREARKFVSMSLASEKRYLPGSKRAKISKIRARIEDIAIFSGLAADFIFVGNNLPSSADINLIKKHGTLLTVFNSSIKWRFERWIFPIFKEIFDENFQKKYSKKELHQALLKSIVSHETCHSLMRYEDATVRLQEYFPFFDELYTDILAVKCCGTLLLKDGLTQKELEAFLLVYICRNLHWLTQIKDQPHTIHYATGGAIFLNFLMQTKTLKKKNQRFFVQDFGKLFICIDQLSHILDYYIALGNYNEAKEFLAKYGSFKLFQKDFLPKLTKIRKK